MYIHQIKNISLPVKYCTISKAFIFCPLYFFGSFFISPQKKWVCESPYGWFCCEFFSTLKLLVICRMKRTHSVGFQFFYYHMSASPSLCMSRLCFIRSSLYIYVGIQLHIFHDKHASTININFDEENGTVMTIIQLAKEQINVMWNR